MITLVHGPDVVSSRSFLLKQKQNYDEVIHLDLKRKEETQIPSHSSLFGTKTLLVIENFDTKKQLDVSQLVGRDVILWAGSALTVPSWIDKEYLFKENENWNTFRFAEFVVSGEELASLKTLKRLLRQNTPSEIIIGTLSRQLRNLSLVIFGELSKATTSPFIQKKLKEQAKNWNQRKITNAAKLVLKADWAIKSGKVSKESALAMLTIQLCSLAKS